MVKTDARVDLFNAKLSLLGISPTQRWLFISIADQRLYAYENDEIIIEFSCSTSAKPPSCQYGSMGTPLGLHRIAEKIGAGQPIGMIFEKREPTGKCSTAPDSTGRTHTTTRILWLDGIEPGKNKGYECGSYNRKVYIHGINLEEKIGTPWSNGCVELKNRDILGLFEWVREGDLVLID